MFYYTLVPPGWGSLWIPTYATWVSAAWSLFFPFVKMLLSFSTPQALIFWKKSCIADVAAWNHPLGSEAAAEKDGWAHALRLGTRQPHSLRKTACNKKASEDGIWPENKWVCLVFRIQVFPFENAENAVCIHCLAIQSQSSARGINGAVTVQVHHICVRTSARGCQRAQLPCCWGQLTWYHRASGCAIA